MISSSSSGSSIVSSAMQVATDSSREMTYALKTCGTSSGTWFGVPGRMNGRPRTRLAHVLSRKKVLLGAHCQACSVLTVKLHTIVIHSK